MDTVPDSDGQRFPFDGSGFRDGSSFRESPPLGEGPSARGLVVTVFQGTISILGKGLILTV